MDVSRLIKAGEKSSSKNELAAVVGIDRDGGFLSTADLHGESSLWSGDGNGLSLRGHSKKVLCSCFGPMGDVLATASADSTIKLWSTSSGELMQTLKGHKAEVKCVAFNKGGRTLCSGSSDGTVRIWRVMDGRCTFIFSEGEGADTTVTSCAFNPREGGDVLLAAGRKDGQLRLWSSGGQGPPSTGGGGGGARAAGGRVVQVLRDGHSRRVRSVVFHAVSANLLCSHADDNSVRVWGMATGEVLQVIEGLGDVLCIQTMPGTGHMLVGCKFNDDIVGAMEKKGEGWREGAVQRIAKSTFMLLGNSNISGAKKRHSGVRLFLVAFDADLVCFSGLLCTAMLPVGHPDIVQACSISPTCEVLATVCANKGCMWSVTYRAIISGSQAANLDEVAITIRDGNTSRAHNGYTNLVNEGNTESTRTNSEWDEEESAGSARGPHGMPEDDGAGVHAVHTSANAPIPTMRSTAGGGLGGRSPSGGRSNVSPPVPPRASRAGMGLRTKMESPGRSEAELWGTDGLGTDELAAMMLHGSGVPQEEDEDDEDLMMVSASVGYSLKPVEPPSLTKDKQDKQRAAIVAVPIEDVLVPAGGHLPQVTGQRCNITREWTGKGAPPLPERYHQYDQDDASSSASYELRC